MSETLQERAMKAAEEAADLQYPGQDGVAAQLRGEHMHGYHNGYIAGAKAERVIARIAALEDAAKMVCWWCRNEKPFGQPEGGFDAYHPFTDIDGKPAYQHCVAAPLRAAIAREREAGKGKGE